MNITPLTPCPIRHLDNFIELLKSKHPFTFIRFSDGETEILRNRYLQIGEGKIVFRGKTTKNVYPQFDSKKFDPLIHQNIRHDLLQAAMYRAEKFYKGIPTAHNKALKDREFMLRLNGGFSLEMTFSEEMASLFDAFKEMPRLHL